MTQRRRIKCCPGCDSPVLGVPRWALGGGKGSIMGIFELGRRAFECGATRRKAVLLGALLTLAATGNALAQGAVKSVHKDWQIRCDTPPGAKAEQCALIQSVTAEDRANVGLTVIVLKTADQKSRLMRVVAPLGVLLPSGLGLKIDQADIGRAGFVRCLPNGCIAEVVMDDELHQKTSYRQERNLHYLPDTGRRYRLPNEPCRLRRRLRQAAVTPLAVRLPQHYLLVDAWRSQA